MSSLDDSATPAKVRANLAIHGYSAVDDDTFNRMYSEAYSVASDFMDPPNVTAVSDGVLDRLETANYPKATAPPAGTSGLLPPVQLESGEVTGNVAEIDLGEPEEKYQEGEPSTTPPDIPRSTRQTHEDFVSISDAIPGTSATVSSDPGEIVRNVQKLNLPPPPLVSTTTSANIPPLAAAITANILSPTSPPGSLLATITGPPTTSTFTTTPRTIHYPSGAHGGKVARHLDTFFANLRPSTATGKEFWKGSYATHMSDIHSLLGALMNNIRVGGGTSADPFPLGKLILESMGFEDMDSGVLSRDISVTVHQETFLWHMYCLSVLFNAWISDGSGTDVDGELAGAVWNFVRANQTFYLVNNECTLNELLAFQNDVTVNWMRREVFMEPTGFGGGGGGGGSAASSHAAAVQVAAQNLAVSENQVAAAAANADAATANAQSASQAAQAAAAIAADVPSSAAAADAAVAAAVQANDAAAQAAAASDQLSAAVVQANTDAAVLAATASTPTTTVNPVVTRRPPSSFPKVTTGDLFAGTDESELEEAGVPTY